MADSRDLEPPPQTHVEDPGAHQLGRSLALSKCVFDEVGLTCLDS